MEKYVPKNANVARVKYLAVSAHKDDTEMFALEGIAKGYDGDGSFAAVIMTDGSGCPRSGIYVDVNGEDMAQLRSAEQKRASEIGHYHALWLMERSSADVKTVSDEVVDELKKVLLQYPSLETLYLHNVFDRHPTHAAAALAAMEALRQIKRENGLGSVVQKGGRNYVMPKRILGCELWRGLDWLPSERKVALDVSGTDELSQKLMDVFESQNAVKRYDKAAIARREANATFNASHEGDESSALIFAIDMTDFVDSDDSAAEFAEKVLDEFREDVLDNVREK